MRQEALMMEDEDEVMVGPMWFPKGSYWPGVLGRHEAWPCWQERLGMLLAVDWP